MVGGKQQALPGVHAHSGHPKENPNDGYGIRNLFPLRFGSANTDSDEDVAVKCVLVSLWLDWDRSGGVCVPTPTPTPRPVLALRHFAAHTRICIQYLHWASERTHSQPEHYQMQTRTRSYTCCTYVSATGNGYRGVLKCSVRLCVCVCVRACEAYSCEAPPSAQP